MINGRIIVARQLRSRQRADTMSTAARCRNYRWYHRTGITPNMQLRVLRAG